MYKIVAGVIAIPCLLSGPLHGAIFRARSLPSNSRRPANTNINLRQSRRKAVVEDAPINGTVTAAVPVLRRSGSCSQVPYGDLELEKRSDLVDLPLNELLIQLQKPTFVTAPNPDGPTIVDIGLYVYEIAKIDPGENTYLMEGFVDLVWCDPRLRFEVNASDPNAVTSHIYLENDAEKELEYIWWPTLFFVNEVMPRRIENEEVIIYADGTVEYREKFGVELSTNYDMRRFPFDSQVLVAEIESFAWPSHILEFHIEEDIVGFSDEFEVPEYDIVGIEEHLEERMEPRDRHAFSELVAEIYVTRDPVYYVTKVIVPLGLIVCISWAVFWMDGEDLADRMAISFTGVLTSVAYQFIVAESLPRHIYNTFLDNFVLFSFVMMALTIVENIGVSMLLKQEKKDTRERIIKMESKIRMMESSRDMMVHPLDDHCDNSADLSLTLEDIHGSPNTDGPPANEEKAATPERNKYLDMFCNCVNPPGTGEEKAKHLDKVCRYIFPLMYAVGVGILAGVQVA